jgi:hypothetical protein
MLPSHSQPPVRNEQLDVFFRSYATASLGSDPARVATFYAAQFIVGGPGGSAVFTNDEKFLDWLRHVHQFNERTGMTSMEVLSVGAAEPLSNRHLLATVEWGATFTKTGERVIAFRISYLLEQHDQTWQILAYLSEKDQEEEMRAHSVCCLRLTQCRRDSGLCPGKSVSGYGAMTGNCELPVGIALGKLLNRTGVGFHVGVCAVPDPIVCRCSEETTAEERTAFLVPDGNVCSLQRTDHRLNVGANHHRHGQHHGSGKLLLSTAKRVVGCDRLCR